MPAMMLWSGAALYGVVWLLFGRDLPPELATHYDLAGQPNGWGTPTGLFLIGAAIVVFMVATSLGSRALVRRLPAGLVNIPNKDYWLTPERRPEAARRVGRELDWFGGLVLLLIDGLYYLVLAANHGAAALNPTALWVGMGIVGVSVVVLIVRLVRVFRVPA